MRLGLDIRGGVDDEQLAFGAQLGATDAIGGDACMPSDSGYFEFLELVVFRQRVESAGLRLYAIENMPWEWTDKIKLGLPGRDEQIDNFCKSLRNMGAAGIPAIGYNFRPPTVTGYGVRTSQSAPGRGGAKQTAFNYDLIKDHPFGDYGEVSAEQMWDNLEYFLKAVIPVAEEAGVRMAVHPGRPARTVYRRRGPHPQQLRRPQATDTNRGQRVQTRWTSAKGRWPFSTATCTRLSAILAGATGSCTSTSAT